MARSESQARPGRRGMILGIGVLLAAGLAWLGADAPPRVPVTGGIVQGSAAPGGGALLFRGIPYAAPPLGERRWKPPGPVVPWNGVRADHADAPACPQNDQGWNSDDARTGREDCLTLDIRTPGLAGKLPVMVWIHGGSNFSGSALGTVQSRITDQGVVLVALQYRLGMLGFLAHRDAAAEAGGAAGNYGLLDQIAALRWIQANIARFGGDPSNVTIFGESAGAQDVSLLLAAPAARGLFANAIMQSGTPGFGMPPRPLEDALLLGDQAGRLLDAPTIAEMRRRPLADLLAADLKLTEPALLSSDFRWLRATIDGVVLPGAPRDLLAEAPPRPVIVGSNRVEFGPGPGEIDWNAQLTHIFGADAAKARAFYRSGDPRMGHPEMIFWTDWIFRCPAGRFAEALADRGAPVWRYEWDVVEGERLTHHSAEIAWVMNPRPFGDGVTLQRYWVNFAKTGDPNGGLPLWRRFTRAAPAHVLFDPKGVTPQMGLRPETCSMLEEL
jgi:para-nitrobenzyl esterase